MIDLPSLSSSHQQLAIAAGLLDALWAYGTAEWERVNAQDTDDRVPTFLVIDEAHNFIPDKTRNDLEERVALSLQRLVAEGRKYGLCLVLASQRPGKLRSGVLLECDNVCLMRIEAPLDHGIIADTWACDQHTIDQVRQFGLGQGLLYGRWVKEATAFRTAHRRTAEGGANLKPEFWARPRA